MSLLRIIADNYFNDSDHTITASNENAEFPASNLLKPKRAYPWRSGTDGNFVITGGNQSIDFDEGAGELNASITNGTHTADGLCIFIKTAMEAVGSDTYTVTYDTTTGKFTIAGDNGNFSILWNTGTNTATSIGSTIGFDTSADDSGADTFTSDDIALHTEEWILIDLGSAKDVDSFAILFDPVDGNKFTSSATVHIQGNASDSWGSPSVNQSVSYDSVYKGFTHFFSSAQTHRYWRVKMVDTQNTNLELEVPLIILGTSTVLGQSPNNGVELDNDDRSKVYENDYGYAYGDEYPIRKRLSFRYSALSEADLNSLLSIYNSKKKIHPFAVALDPLATVFDKDKYFLWGRFNKSIVEKQVWLNYFDTECEIVEVF